MSTPVKMGRVELGLKGKEVDGAPALPDESGALASDGTVGTPKGDDAEHPGEGRACAADDALSDHEERSTRGTDVGLERDDGRAPSEQVLTVIVVEPSAPGPGQEAPGVNRQGSKTSQASTEELVCFICMSNDDPSEPLVIGRCACVSSAVHARCLEEWTTAAQARERQSAMIARRRDPSPVQQAVPLPKPTCPVCRQPYERLEFESVVVGARSYLCKLGIFVVVWLSIGAAAVTMDMILNKGKLEYTLAYLVLTVAVLVRILALHDRHMRRVVQIKRSASMRGHRRARTSEMHAAVPAVRSGALPDAVVISATAATVVSAPMPSAAAPASAAPEP